MDTGHARRRAAVLMAALPNGGRLASRVSAERAQKRHSGLGITAERAEPAPEYPQGPERAAESR